MLRRWIADGSGRLHGCSRIIIDRFPANSQIRQSVLGDEKRIASTVKAKGA